MLPELVANDPIFALCKMTEDGMQKLLVWIKYKNTLDKYIEKPTYFRSET
jgi:hypothetical protein